MTRASWRKCTRSLAPRARLLGPHRPLACFLQRRAVAFNATIGAAVHQHNSRQWKPCALPQTTIVSHCSRMSRLRCADYSKMMEVRFGITHCSNVNPNRNPNPNQDGGRLRPPHL